MRASDFWFAARSQSQTHSLQVIAFSRQQWSNKNTKKHPEMQP